MHDQHLAKTIVHTLEEKAKSLTNLKKITAITLKVGQLKFHTIESFEAAFNQVSKDTLCADAKLLIEVIPGNDFVIENIEGEFSE